MNVFDYENYSIKLIENAKIALIDYFDDKQKEQTVLSIVEKYSLLAGQKIVNNQKLAKLPNYKQMYICETIVLQIFAECLSLFKGYIKTNCDDYIYPKILDSIIEIYEKNLFLGLVKNPLLINKINKNTEKIHNEFVCKYFKIKDINDIPSILQSYKSDIAVLNFGENLLDMDLGILSGYVDSKILNIREKYVNSLGYKIPVIRTKNEESIQPDEYQILIRDNIVEKGNFQPNIESLNEVFKNLEKLLIKNVHKILTISDIQKNLDLVKKEQGEILVNNLLKELDIYKIKTILCNLIQDEYSIKDLPYIVENLADFARFDKNVDILTNKLKNILTKASYL